MYFLPIRSHFKGPAAVAETGLLFAKKEKKSSDLYFALDGNNTASKYYASLKPLGAGPHVSTYDEQQ